MSTERIARLDAPKGYCRGCQQPVPKGRRRWCSDRCVKAALIKLDPKVARLRVEQRDHGVCARCGFDAKQAERLLRVLQSRALGSRYPVERLPERDAADALSWVAKIWGVRADRWHIGHLWEADHIVPVVEGGGACELENYRTLCILCHRIETKHLAARRAARRRQEIAAQRLERWHGAKASSL